ncbi:bifunctional 2-dehydro-3-deoxygluconokinase/2-dehydro-3-deoxygalactonokinase [Natrinema salifodinae]|uniref:2-dehydro-3-deoxygluconokinase n=1 Tax=Natrinema salifodinae TaxID=1202768 RepID=A0A1I0QTH3_9EURY|nr:bifunctional 2-dehydro-3-deoxygluconokinase/2-dehydro-3-deoxygalactonokinase [Natrinema salifodinae]SEW30656.1 2-dehydro-3-deoxygluconokinase [Natrinema salifodinae]
MTESGESGTRSPSLVTFGETMIRFSPSEGTRIETATELEFRSAGAESNVAIAAANLGTSTAWLSKLPDSPLGRKVVRDVRQNGVEPNVAWSDDGRQGAYYLEHGPEPRGIDVIYDRTDAAVTTATVDDLDIDAVRNADVFFTSGITPALSSTLAETTQSLLQTARDAGVTTAFDCNYRSKLWSPSAAREAYESLFESVDLLFVPERDAIDVLEIDGDAAAIATHLRETYGCSTVVVTRGERGALAVDASGTVEQATFDAETVDPIGTGDAFVGGFLAKRSEDGSTAESLRYGAATAALKRTMTGDHAVVTRSEVDALIDRDSGGISR